LVSIGKDNAERALFYITQSEYAFEPDI